MAEKICVEGHKVLVLIQEGREVAVEEVVDGMVKRTPYHSKFAAWKGILTRNPRRLPIYVVIPVEESKEAIR